MKKIRDVPGLVLEVAATIEYWQDRFRDSIRAIRETRDRSTLKATDVRINLFLELLSDLALEPWRSVGSQLHWKEALSSRNRWTSRGDSCCVGVGPAKSQSDLVARELPDRPGTPAAAAFSIQSGGITGRDQTLEGNGDRVIGHEGRSLT